MRKIKKIMTITSSITTATLIVSAFWNIISALSEGKNLITATVPLMILPEILLMGLFTGIGTTLIINEDCASRKEDLIRRVIHCAYICIVVLVMGGFFDWYSPTPSGILLMLFSILAVYLFTFFTNYYQSKRLADKLNEKLEQINE